MARRQYIGLYVYIYIAYTNVVHYGNMIKKKIQQMMLYPLPSAPETYYLF